MKKKCDKCHSDIINNECSCGTWFEEVDHPTQTKIFEEAILEYNKMNLDCPLTGDHHSGTCIILFKGNYEMSQQVKEFIENLTGKSD